MKTKLPPYLLDAIAEYGNAMLTTGNDRTDDFNRDMAIAIATRETLEEAIDTYAAGKYPQK